MVDNSEPAMRKRQSVKDTIRQLIQSGELEGVSLNETSIANIAEKVSANEPMKQGHHGKDQGHEGKKGGRPYMPKHLKRGIHGGARSNIRKKDEKPRKWELPISTKHEICKKLDGARSEFPDECDLFNHFSKQLKMRSDKLRDIYHEKSKWAKEMLKHQQSSGAYCRKDNSGLSRGKKASGGNKMRLRASGGGAKRQFPHLYDEVKDWLEMERSHGHGVPKVDLAWRYYKLLSAEKKRLEKQRDELDEGPERILCMNQLDRAESQMKSFGEG